MVNLRNLLVSLLFLLSSVFFIYPGTGNAQATVEPGTESSGYFFFRNGFDESDRPENACVGGSRSDSKVAMWTCANINRYKWQIHSSEVPGWYYLVNAENGKCLSRWSRGNKIRYYGFSEEPCRQSDYRLWRFGKLSGTFLPPSFTPINPQDLRTEVTTLLQIKVVRDGCLSQREYSRGLSIQSCGSVPNSQYPIRNRIFIVNPSFPGQSRPFDSFPGQGEKIQEENQFKTTKKLA